MASLKCSFCGYGIHHHGDPEGTEPVEHVFCLSNDWHKLEKENMISNRVEMEHWGTFVYAWKCARCGSFSFFADYVNVSDVYTPVEKFSSAPMNEPIEFGPFWNEILWFDINEADTPTAEVLTRYPQNLWLAKNADEMRLYTDEARTNCVGQFRRISVPKTITVKTMSLESFKKILARWDDVEFFYRGEYFNFMREDGEINVWRGHDYVHSVYCVSDDGKDFVDDLINAKIFPDGKSIVEAQADIEL